MADVILEARERQEIRLLPKEIEILRQERTVTNDSGMSVVRLKFVPIRDRIAPVFEMFSRLLGKDFRLDKSSGGWVDFGVAIDLRNRITHPRNAGSFNIVDSELNTVERARQWFAAAVEALLGDC
jgi:hypothetical protein